METLQENTFDPEQFRAALKAKTEQYATNKYITFGRGDDLDENKRKEKMAKTLREELLDDCAEALLAANDQDGMMEIIRNTLVKYQYGSGIMLFAGSQEASFYHDLALRVARKASGR